MNKTPFLQGGIALLLGLGIGMSVQAAEPVAKLLQINGKVLVNKGKDYTGAQPGMQLGHGDRVLVLAGGSAQVVYQDGCVLRLGSNSLLTLEGKQQCTKGAIVATFKPGLLAQAGGAAAANAAGAAGAGEAGAAVTGATIAGIPVAGIVVGAVVVGGIAAGAAASSGGGGGGGGGAVVPISPQ